jgi:hypothetical protein
MVDEARMSSNGGRAGEECDDVRRRDRRLTLTGYLLGVAYIGQILLTAYLASRLGRTRILWVTYAAFLPIVAPIHALLLRRQAHRKP